MRFDWYSATVHGADADEVLPVLVGGLDDLRDMRPGRPHHGYHHGAEVVRGERKFASVWWGGNGGGVHVQSSGEESADTAARLRHAFPVHSLTRADVCEDYTAPGAWDVLSRLCLDVADEQGIRVNHAGDWHRCKDGRTIYLGAPSSVTRLRVYEKGLQLGVDPNLVRVELVTRPKGDARVACAQAQPAQFFGASKWSQEIAGRLGVSDVDRMRCGTVYRDSDVERTRHALCKQYGPALLAWAAEVGGAESLGLAVLERVQEIRTRQRR